MSSLVEQIGQEPKRKGVIEDSRFFAHKGVDLRAMVRCVAPQRERPDAGINKEAQSRARPAL